MKKVIIIVLAVVVVIALIIGVVFAVLNKEKTPMTAEEFKTTMEAKNYVVIDATEQFAEYDYVKQVYLAVYSDNNYQIEFYELSDEANAIAFYNNNKEMFETYKGNASSNTEASFKNYSKFVLSASGKFMVISRIANTAIYVNVDSSIESTVKELLKSLGY